LKTFTSTTHFSPSTKTIITIGTFDGVHIGHKKILQKVVAEAKKNNLTSAVLTFFPHPRFILNQNSDLKLLNTIEEKKALLNSTELDALLIHPFDQEFANLSPEQFVKKILVDQLKISKIIIGYDHRFGKNRSADINDLIQFGTKYNFEVEQISAQELNEIAISSTKIRTALNEGNINLANNYLGYPYSFSGKVIKGKQIGRTIGFPTANIEIQEPLKLLPKNGVYIVKCLVKNQEVNGIMNIGNRPTVNGTSQSIEVHLLNFDEDIYGLEITVKMIDFIRNEQKFENLDQLKSQIQKDKIQAVNFIKNTAN
jgi:riboflavin kinase/FMN adenylyltransferase